ncbi:hypothetical protein, partial [Gokushovirinae Bog5712_52]|uniref:hypothetical protein n=1 Tax=Gokushovirinae Bog5712_52 TaxID=1655649 RepID=UPI00063D5E59
VTPALLCVTFWARVHPGPFFNGGFMRPLKRKHVSKGKSAKTFRKHSHHSKAPNVAQAPMRGGWRL